jgi:hypothetical protein
LLNQPIDKVDDKRNPLFSTANREQMWKPVATLFTAERAAAMNDLLKSDFPDELGKLGKIQVVELLERKSESDSRIYRYRVSFHSMPLFVQCVFNKDGKIARFAVGD